MCESVSKWKLQIRLGMDKWSHPSGSFTMLGDAVHATLPYLASGFVLPFSSILTKPPFLIPSPLTLFLAQACPSKTPPSSANASHAIPLIPPPQYHPPNAQPSKPMPLKPTNHAELRAHAWSSSGVIYNSISIIYTMDLSRKSGIERCGWSLRPRVRRLLGGTPN